MLDWKGNLINKKNRQHFLLSDIEEDATIAVTSEIFSTEMREVETLIDAAHQYDDRPRPGFTPSPREVDQVSTLMASISPTLENVLLYEYLQYRYEIGNFKSSIRSTNGTTSQFLVDNDTKATEPSTNDDFLVESTNMLDDLYAETVKGTI